MAVDTAVPEHMKAQRARDLAAGISCDDGVEAFKRILANPRSQWIVDARGLLAAEPAKVVARSVSDRKESAPQPMGSSVRARVAGIWAELLGVSAPNDEDDFFALGGDSLLAVQLRARLEEQFDRPVPLRTLLRQTTLQSMTALLSLQQQGALIGIQPRQASHHFLDPPRDHLQLLLAIWRAMRVDPDLNRGGADIACDGELLEIVGHLRVRMPARPRAAFSVPDTSLEDGMCRQQPGNRQSRHTLGTKRCRGGALQHFHRCAIGRELAGEPEHECVSVRLSIGRLRR